MLLPLTWNEKWFNAACNILLALFPPKINKIRTPFLKLSDTLNADKQR